MSDQNNIEKRLIQLQDSLDSIHQRMDRFYSWAGLLQSEFRSMKQRTGFVEGLLQERFEFTQNQPSAPSTQERAKVFGSNEDDALWARMMRISGKKPDE
jgi:hypothetical protein